MEVKIGTSTVELVTGDFTRQESDAIVNAANSRLGGGGGVDGAIHRTGGPSIMAETRQKYPQGCLTGDAVITGAGAITSVSSWPSKMAVGVLHFPPCPQEPIVIP